MNKKNKSKLTFKKTSIANLDLLNQSDTRQILGGSGDTPTTPTYVPINCQP